MAVLPARRPALSLRRSKWSRSDAWRARGLVDAKEATHLLTSDFKAAYSDPGYLLFVRGESILAQPFDAGHLRLTGEPVVVADRIWVARSAAQASFSVSPTGVLAGSDQTLMAVPVTATEGAFEVGRPRPLFRTRIIPEGSQSLWFDTM